MLGSNWDNPKLSSMPKGNQVNIPESGSWILYGNVNELGDISRCPGKSSLFFLTTNYDNPGIRLYGDRVRRSVKHFTF